MPTYLPKRLQVEIAIFNNTFTASFRSSKPSAKMPESLSIPNVSWVKSLEPIEKPSKYSKNCSANNAFDGISHIIIKRKPFSPRFKPCLAIISVTALASSMVRTNGSISSTFTKPISSRTFFIASHSIAKHS